MLACFDEVTLEPRDWLERCTRRNNGWSEPRYFAEPDAKQSCLLVVEVLR
jgi:hypothetical protein